MGVRRINLLPPEERAKVKRERGLVYALLALVIVVAALGILYVFANQQKSSREQELAGLQSQLTQLQQQVAGLSVYEQQQSQRAIMTQTAKQIYDSRVIWSSIFEEISLLIPEECSLTELTAAVPVSMLAGSAAAGAAPPAVGTGTDVTLTGEALTHRDVAEFMTRLGLMPQLMNITLVSAAKATSDTGDVITFQIVAALRPFQSPAPNAAGTAAAATSAVEAPAQ
jgi:Tfp pilus assembly protein PilN